MSKNNNKISQTPKNKAVKLESLKLEPSYNEKSFPEKDSGEALLSPNLQHSGPNSLVTKEDIVTDELGPELWIRQDLSKDSFIKICDEMNCYPEAISSGGFRYKTNIGFKTLRLIFGGYPFEPISKDLLKEACIANEWPFISKNTPFEWRGNKEVIIHGGQIIKTMIKSFYGAEAFTVQELRNWKDVFAKFNIECKGIPLVDSRDRNLSKYNNLGLIVYLVRSGNSNYYKIGYSSRFACRLTELQTGNPELLSLITFCSGGREIEEYFHEKYSLYRGIGEWFTFDAEKLSLVIREFETITHRFLLTNISKELLSDNLSQCVPRLEVSEFNMEENEGQEKEENENQEEKNEEDEGGEENENQEEEENEEDEGEEENENKEEENEGKERQTTNWPFFLKDNIYKRSFCHKITDNKIRKKWLFVTQVNPKWDTSKINLIINEVKEKIAQVKYLESAIWRIEINSNNFWSCLRMQLTFNNLNCRDIINQVSELFFNSYIMSVDYRGVEEVRKFCAKTTSRNLDDVYTVGKINKLDYITTLPNAVDGIINTRTDSSMEQGKIKKKNFIENLEIKLLLADIKYWFDLMMGETNPFLREKWKIMYEELKKMSSSQYALISSSSMSLTREQIKEKIFREVSLEEKKSSNIPSHLTYTTDIHPVKNAIESDTTLKENLTYIESKEEDEEGEEKGLVVNSQEKFYSSKKVEEKKSEEGKFLDEQIPNITKQYHDCKDKKKLTLLEIQNNGLAKLGKISTFSSSVGKRIKISIVKRT
jgi:hypothetical protein